MERGPLLGLERREELVLQAGGECAELPERALAVGRESDDVPAPVLRIALSLDEPPLLEFVEESDERPPVVAERVCDRRLRLGHSLVEQREDCMVVRAQARPLVFVEGALLRGEAEPLE